MSKVIIKTKDDIAKIKQAVAIWKKCRKVIRDFVKPGVSLLEIDELAKNTIIENGGKPTFYKKYGFPGNICVSVNQCVIHGVPTNYIIQEKDMITFDVGVTYEDHVCDAAFTVIVGHNPIAKQINDICLAAIYHAASSIIPNVTTNMSLAKRIQNFVEVNGYKVLHDFTGHGCGNELHEEPMIPNYYSNLFKKEVLRPNMVICIEPMILTDDNAYIIDPKDQWSVIAKNQKLTCHWEHMILITENGYEILTGEDN